MSLYGMMRTSTSGMSAQANRLSAVADNIANVNAHGYKRATCEFSSLLLASCPASYTSGAVLTGVRRAVAEQGNLQNSTSVTDLAVNGEGFFVVQDADGTPVLTRAGGFVPDGEGELVNAAGFRLMGYPAIGSAAAAVVNGFAGLEPVNLKALSLIATPSRRGEFAANLPAGADVTPAAALPSANLATSASTAKSSLIAYGNLGEAVTLDLYFSKTAANVWEVSAFDRAGASASGFPYAAGPLLTRSLSFNAADGKLDLASAGALTIPVPGGAPLALDIGAMSQLAAPYGVQSAHVDGNAPDSVELIEIARDGTLHATYGNGTKIAAYRIPLAQVASPGSLIALSGNVFTASQASGDVQIGTAEAAGLGSIQSGAIEQSNVDLATELTTMIDAQRGYTANSKVFQTGSELMDVLISLKR